MEKLLPLLHHWIFFSPVVFLVNWCVQKCLIVEATPDPGVKCLRSTQLPDDGYFLPSNILLTPWPSASTMLSSRANTSCLSWQNEPVCVKMRVSRKQNNQQKSLPFLIFVWNIRSACFDAFCQPTNSRKHLDMPITGWWDASGTFPSETMTVISFLYPKISTLFCFGEVNDGQFPLSPPYQKLNFFWIFFYFLPWLRLAELDVDLYMQICKFLFSRLEMGFFSLYLFLLELSLVVEIPNKISWLWSAQSVLQADSSTLYRKTKYWPKPVFLLGLPWVDKYCGTWSLCVSACKKPKHKYFNRVRRLFCIHF